MFTQELVTASNDPVITLAQGEVEAPPQPRGENGKFVKVPTAEEKEAEARALFGKLKEQDKRGGSPVAVEQPKEAAQAAPEEEAIAESEVDKEAHAAALANAKRLKIPAKALAAMSKAEIVQAGQDWARQISENGKLSREIGELREQAKARTAPTESASSKDEQPDDDVGKVLQPLIAKLDLDDETGKTLSEMFKVLEARHSAQVKSLQAELGKVAEERTMRLVQEAKGKLLERFPQLGEEDGEQRVLARMASLNKTGDYDNYADLMTDACKIELPPAASAPQVSQQPSTAKRNGVALTQNSAPKPVPLTPEQEEKAIFDKIMEQARQHPLRDR